MRLGFRLLTRADEKIQKIMDRGSATIYRTRPVKFNNNKKFPVKPQARDTALEMISH